MIAEVNGTKSQRQQAKRRPLEPLIPLHFIDPNSQPPVGPSMSTG